MNKPKPTRVGSIPPPNIWLKQTNEWMKFSKEETLTKSPSNDERYGLIMLEIFEIKMGIFIFIHIYKGVNWSTFILIWSFMHFILSPYSFSFHWHEKFIFICLDSTRCKEFLIKKKRTRNSVVHCRLWKTKWKEKEEMVRGTMIPLLQMAKAIDKCKKHTRTQRDRSVRLCKDSAERKRWEEIIIRKIWDEKKKKKK